VGNAIKCLLDNNHDVYVFDHGSTDKTAESIARYPEANYVYVDRGEFPNFTKPGTNNIHFKVTSFICQNKGSYDWVTWIDADEILESNSKGKTLKDDIQIASDNGHHGIQSVLRNYWITSGDDTEEEDYLKRITQYEDKPPYSSGGINRS
jgi:glycosyltransferase involved in cell wall biosynthesis